MEIREDKKEVIMYMSNPFESQADIEKQMDRLIKGEINTIEINALSSGAFMNMFKLEWPEKENIIDQACIWKSTMEYKGMTIEITGAAMWAQIVLSCEMAVKASFEKSSIDYDYLEDEEFNEMEVEEEDE